MARRALFEVGGLSVRDTMPNLGRTIRRRDASAASVLFQRGSPNLQDTEQVYAVAHITGALVDNIPRVMPSDVRVVIEKAVLDAITDFPDDSNHREHSRARNVTRAHMGIGEVQIVDRFIAAAVVQRLKRCGESAAVHRESTGGVDESSDFMSLQTYE